MYYQNPYTQGCYQPNYYARDGRQFYQNNGGDFYNRLNREKRELRSMSNMCAGFILISFVVMQFALALPLLRNPKLAYLYENKSVFSSSFYIFYSTIGIFLISLLFYKAFSKKYGSVYYRQAFSKPKNIKLLVSGTFAGTALTLSGNFLVSFLIMFLKLFGFELPENNMPEPHGAFAILLSFAATALIPALNEEFAMRFNVMQPLRKYGDAFAVVTSAALFAVFHGNPAQIPFAFIGGLAMGYFAISTGSIMTAMAIHFINNSVSIFFSLVRDRLGEEYAESVSSVLFSVIFILGIISAVIFILSKDRIPLKASNSLMTASQKAKAFFVSPLMIIAILIMLITALRQINYVGSNGSIFS